MDFSLTEDQKLIRSSLRDWCAKNFPIERVQELDKKGPPYPTDILEGLCNLGVIMGTIPREHGGPGLDWQTQAMIAEELGYADPSDATGTGLMGVETGWGFTIDRHCTPEVRETFVKPALKGKGYLGIADTEAVGGSDLTLHRTVGKKDGESWVINGEKSFITGTEEAPRLNGGWFINALTGQGDHHRALTAFFVPANSEGIEIHPVYNDAGGAGFSHGSFTMTNVRVPDKLRLSEENRGFYMAMEGFDNARLMVAGGSIGMARRVLEVGQQYIKQRVLFGKPIAKFEGVQWPMVELYEEIESVRLMYQKAAWMQDIRYKEEGMPDKVREATTFSPKEVSKNIAMPKWKGPHLAVKVADEVMHWLGAAGYCDEYPVEMAWRGAMGGCIGAEGARDVLKTIIGREILGREFIPYR